MEVPIPINVLLMGSVTWVKLITLARTFRQCKFVPPWNSSDPYFAHRITNTIQDQILFPQFMIRVFAFDLLCYRAMQVFPCIMNFILAVWIVGFLPTINFIILAMVKCWALHYTCMLDVTSNGIIPDTTNFAGPECKMHLRSYPLVHCPILCVLHNLFSALSLTKVA